ncbi:ataxin-2-like protein [Cavia porcellus]|uniref:ataxin-2-like protein n=1 Tax=Cavia porcellus TaxID=10141 RepID=UPI002FE2FC6F
MTETGVAGRAVLEVAGRGRAVPTPGAVGSAGPCRSGPGRGGRGGRGGRQPRGPRILVGYCLSQVPDPAPRHGAGPGSRLSGGAHRRPLSFGGASLLPGASFSRLSRRVEARRPGGPALWRPRQASRQFQPGPGDPHAEGEEGRAPASQPDARAAAHTPGTPEPTAAGFVAVRTSPRLVVNRGSGGLSHAPAAVRGRESVASELPVGLAPCRRDDPPRSPLLAVRLPGPESDRARREQSRRAFGELRVLTRSQCTPSVCLLKLDRLQVGEEGRRPRRAGETRGVCGGCLGRGCQAAVPAKGWVLLLSPPHPPVPRPPNSTPTPSDEETQSSESRLFLGLYLKPTGPIRSTFAKILEKGLPMWTKIAQFQEYAPASGSQSERVISFYHQASLGKCCLKGKCKPTWGRSLRAI